MIDYYIKDSASTFLKVRPFPLKKAALYSAALIAGILILGSYAKAMDAEEGKESGSNISKRATLAQMVENAPDADAATRRIICDYPGPTITPLMAQEFEMPEPTKISLPPVQFAKMPQPQTPLRSAETDESNETEGS